MNRHARLASLPANTQRLTARLRSHAQSPCQHGRMDTVFLTINDVAERLQLSTQGVRSLILSGELPALQVGARRLWRIPESSFAGYIDHQMELTRQMIAKGEVPAGADD